MKLVNEMKEINEVIKLLSNNISDNIDLKHKEEYAKNILNGQGFQHHKIITLTEDNNVAMKSNGTNIFIPLEGYFIIQKYNDEIDNWSDPQLLACMEPFKINEINIAIRAIYYPASYILIHALPSDTLVNNYKLNIPDISQSERERLGYYCGYDMRYRTVYNEGASTWETKNPNEILVYINKNFPEWFNDEIIDLGCGEGRDSIFLAKNGYSVTGVDISRAALSKARQLARESNIKVDFVERDIIFLRGFKQNYYSLAINMGCLHMITDSTQRLQHLKKVFEILKPGGRLIIAHCRENWGKGFYSIPNWDELPKLKVGEKILRRIRTDNPKEIELPIIPYKEANSKALIDELNEAGFNVEMELNEETDAFGDTEVLVAIKK